MVLADDLRLSVYQTALQGKLTEQLASDSSVETLIEHIQSIKNKMILDGKIKKEKKLPPVDDEVLFDIPDNWKWVRMQTFLDVRDGTHDSPKYVPEGVPFVTSKNISKGYLDFSDINYITQIDADKINQRSLVEDNDILLAMIGSIGNPVKVKKDREFAIKNMALIKAVPDSQINMDYVLLLLKYMQIKFKFDSSGGVQNFVSLTYLREFQVPLPPVEEQQRIVERVDKLMEQIDEYAKIEQQLISLKDSFPGDLRSAVLQAAMQGKLTERSVDDMDVDDLIRHARNERKLLIDNKDIKNEKLTEISDEDYPYEIPDSWRFIRLGEVIRLQSGQDMTPDMYSDVISEGVPYLTGASNIDNGRVIINRWTKSPKAIAEKGDLLLTCKGTVGLLAFLNEEQVHIARQIMSIKPLALVNLGYIKYCIDSFILLLKAKAKSEIPGIDRKVVLNLLIPLPPIEEQGRIVERLEGLLPLCESVMEE